MCKTLQIISFLASGLPLLAHPADTGSLTGTVRDQAGTRLSYVIISLKNATTSAETFTHSSSEGVFRFANLSVGSYTMVVSATGFCKAQIENVAIRRHHTLAAQLTLSPVESMVVKIPVAAQQPNPADDVKTVKTEIASLQSRLALSAAQQAQIEAILMERRMLIAVARDDQSLTQPERRERISSVRREADAKMRTAFNENQLDEYDEILRERRQLAQQKLESGSPSRAAALARK